MRKISYGKIVLIIMYAFVSLFVLMFINSILEAANDDRYYNDFYSTNVRKFAVNSGKGSELQFRDLGKDYALFFDMKTTDPSGMEIDDGTRAVYFKGDLPHPTMISGRFFTQEELDSNAPVAVIGSLVERNIIERDGKKYYSYQGVNYEIIGYMGREGETTDLDLLSWINMGAYFERGSTNGSFFVDTESEDETTAVVNNFLNILPEKVREKTVEISHDRKLRTISYFTQVIYQYVFVAIIINIAIVSVYYIDKRMYIIAVKKLVGASFASIATDIIAEYVSFSSIGVVVGLICSYLLRFTPFADSDEVFFMSYSVPSVGAMFVITVLLSIVVSIIPIIRVYRYDLSQVIK